MRSRPIRVFVSATADLEPEREVIGETLAKFPVPLPWQIKRTPYPGEQRPEALREVRESDFYILLLGEDITAPVGAELDAALEAGVLVFAIVKDVAHTPAGRFFRYNSIEWWESFGNVGELRRLVVHRFSQALVDGSPGYGLSAEEIAGLMQYLRKVEKGEGAEAEEGMVSGKEPAGAQDGAIIVAP